MIIYQIKNTITGKSYIGQTIDSLNRRWSAHQSVAREKSPKWPFHRAIKKYGKENFKVEILTKAGDKKELDQLEKEYIRECNTLVPYGYNLDLGGQDSKERHILSRKKMSENQQKKPVYGIHIFTKEKISFPSIHAVKEKGFDSKCVMMCCARDPSHIQHKEYQWSYEGSLPDTRLSDRHNRFRPIIAKKGNQTIEFSTLQDVINQGYNRNGIFRALDKTRKTYKGFIWDYKNVS